MTIVLYAIIGFAAQLIDGTMGMAYGVSCRTLLRSVAGLGSVAASAVVHCAELPMALISGIAHWKLRNVDKKLMLMLLIPGVLGAAAGAWLLTGVGQALEPFIDAYLIIMGAVIIRKAFGRRKEPKNSRLIYPLGFVGGFCDAVGGGGWGPVVTSTMLASGHEPRKTIGSVNAAEFFVTVAETTAFAAALIADFSRCWQILLGLVAGGVLAAPLAAWLCTKVKVKPLMIAVGALVIALNVFNLVSWFN